MIATITKSATETHGTTKEHASATTYAASDTLPLRSLPIASASFDSGPCEASRQIVRIVYATRAAEEHDRVDGDRAGLDARLAKPGGRDRGQREAEQQADVRPERPAVDPVDDLHQVVVVDPVDRDEDEAEQVGEQAALLVQDVGQVAPRRRPQLEDENGDQDRDHAVRERVHPLRPHRATMPPRARLRAGVAVPRRRFGSPWRRSTSLRCGAVGLASRFAVDLVDVIAEP